MTGSERKSRNDRGRGEEGHRGRPAFGKGRSAATLLVVLLASWIVDLRARAAVWIRFRNDEAGRVRAMNDLIRWWGGACCRACGFFLRLRLEVEGRIPRSGRFLVLSNHQSTLDIPYLIHVFRGLNLKFVAKSDLVKGRPGVSAAIRWGGFAVVAKRSLGEDLHALQAFARDLERFDGSAMIFPEGIRSFDGSIGPFQFAGAEIVRRNGRLPILPVVLDGMAGARDITRLHRAIGSTVRVRVLEPIAFEDEADPRALADRIEDLFRETLQAMRSS